MISGILQGSPLGPLFILVILNNLTSSVTSRTKIFADNTKQYTAVEGFCSIDQLQANIYHMADWPDKIWPDVLE